MRKMLYLWTQGKTKPCKLSARQRRQLSDNLLILQPFVPVEFQRKPRALKELDRFKATEFRQFLLYTGPVVLKNVLSREYFEHFLIFHAAITILCSEKYHREFNNDAADLLKIFVRDFPKLYGKNQVSYNVHGLLHLSSDSLLLGPLDNFSTFPFENNLQHMKKLVKSTRLPLIQISNRICEKMQISSMHSNQVRTAASIPHTSGPTLNIPVQEQYRKLVLPKFTVRLNDADNTFILKCGSVIQVKNIVKSTQGKLIIIGRKYSHGRSFYSYPCESTAFKIQRNGNTFRDLQAWGCIRVANKMRFSTIQRK